MGIVTFNRAPQLEAVLSALKNQSLLPHEVLVADNGASRDVELMCARMGATYIKLDQNLGPAGGTNALMEAFVQRGQPGAWLMRVDDDRPPEHAGFFDEVYGVANTLYAALPNVGGVGLAGARVSRLKFSRDHDVVEPLALAGVRYSAVDWLATDCFPMWPWQALSAGDRLCSSLFFGFTEVEFGIRQVADGRLLLALPDMYLKYLPDVSQMRRSKRRREVTWRKYYEARNGIVVGRRHFGLAESLRISLRSILRGFSFLFLAPRNRIEGFKLSLRGVVDAWLGNLGKTVDPLEWSRRHNDLLDDGSLKQS